MKRTWKTKATRRFEVRGSRLALAAILFLIGCGSSQQKEGMQELEKIQVEVHGLHILVSAGVTKQEYSQRLEDVLLKAGDLDQNSHETVPKFTKAKQDMVKETYVHLANSIDAYKAARNYFGSTFQGSGCEYGCVRLSQEDYDAEKARFPTLVPLQPTKAPLNSNSSAWYFRDDMLRALWTVAGEEDDKAKQLTDRLTAK